MPQTSVPGAPPSQHRCHRCWWYWLTGCGITFSYLEARGFRKGCHRTLSRELRALLGRRGCWLFTVLGTVFSIHLLKLTLEDA